MDIAINNAYIPDFENLKFKKANVGIKEGKIALISTKPITADRMIDAKNGYLTPGLIDCHCHIESSHLMPSSFGNEILKHGTLHAVCDCHEIANVKGRNGLEFFINDAHNTPCNLKFAIPSCVPATDFATSGGKIDVEDVEYFLNFEDVVALGELMNMPAVINRDEKFMKMIEITKKHKKHINGHAPHLTGVDLDRYIAAGVEDDHENETYEEIKEKLQKGMHIFIREGSAEKTQDSAYRIINEYPDSVMFCTDDKTIGDIKKEGHINHNLKKAIKLGINPVLAIKVASYNGLKYYGLDKYSEIKTDNFAYLVLFDENFDVKTVILDGKIVSETQTKHDIPKELLHTINLNKVDEVPSIEHKNISMVVESGSLITKKETVEKNTKEFDIEKDILKLCVFERYGNSNKSACRIKGFGLKKGAIASSLAHDCHNIIAVGVSDDAILTAVNEVIRLQGGLVLFDGQNLYSLPLNVGGIVSSKNADDVVEDVELLQEKLKEIGCTLDDGFATLSFMALEVIPHIKLTDKGLFDVDRFEYVKD